MSQEFENDLRTNFDSRPQRKPAPRLCQMAALLDDVIRQEFKPEKTKFSSGDTPKFEYYKNNDILRMEIKPLLVYVTGLRNCLMIIERTEKDRVSIDIFRDNGNNLLLNFGKPGQDMEAAETEDFTALMKTGLSFDLPKPIGV